MIRYRCLINQFVFVVLVGVVAVSCNHQKEMKQSDYKVSTNELVKMNRDMVNQESAVIERFVTEKGYKMTKTSTGMWYRMDVEGKGEKAKVGQTVYIRYTIRLLDESICYSSDSLGVKSFRLGQGGVESGLEEGLLLMKKSGKATFIMPSYLAHGLTGDQNKIPSRSILIYETELVDLH